MNKNYQTRTNKRFITLKCKNSNMLEGRALRTFDVVK